MVTMDALQLNRCPQTGQIIEQNVIILQSTTVLLAPSINLGSFAQATQLTAVQDVNVTVHFLSDF